MDFWPHKEFHGHFAGLPIKHVPLIPFVTRATPLQSKLQESLKVKLPTSLVDHQRKHVYEEESFRILWNIIENGICSRKKAVSEDYDLVVTRVLAEDGMSLTMTSKAVFHDERDEVVCIQLFERIRVSIAGCCSCTGAKAQCREESLLLRFEATV